MVARPGTYQASNNAGELAPEVYGRTDLKQFYSGLAIARNIEPVPQGGSQLSMRSRHLGRVRRKTANLSLTASTLPSGSYSAPAILATATFAVADVASVLLTGFASSVALGAIVQIEYFDGTNWLLLGAPFALDQTQRNITMAAPPRQPVHTTQVRVRMVSAPPDTTMFTLPGISVRVETTTPSDAVARPFTFALDQTYVAILTDRFVDFYRDGTWVGSSVMDFTESQIRTLDVPQRLDTMLMFNRDGVSQRILRDGSDTRWVLSNISFENVPLVDLGGTYTNQSADAWLLILRFPTTAGDPHLNGAGLSLSINVNGEDAVVGFPGGAPDWTVISGLIKTAIEGTSSVSPGISVTPDAPQAGSQTIFIRFTGDGNLGNANALSAQVVNTADAAAVVAHSVIGDPGGEALFSASRGYAACGAFYQDRLVTGGFKAKRGAFLASVTGEYFDDNVKLQAASGAILANLDTDGAEQLQRIVSDTYLLLFTSDGEYFISDRVLDRTKPPNIVNSSRYGSSPDLPIVRNEGEIVWASRNKSVLYAASYDQISTKYAATPISLLAPHIVNGMVDIALQRPSGLMNAARLWMPRADGTVTCGIMLRNQDVTAFVRWETPGSVTSACVDGKNVPHLLVNRVVGGASEMHFERLEEGLIFDDVVEQTFGSPQTVITGLGVHEGAEVWAKADGYVVGPYTVAGGAITLTDPALNVQVGRWTPPLARTLPLPSEVAERVVLRRPKRVHTVRLDLVDTTSVAVGANGRPARDVALARAGDPADAPQAPVNEMKVITGLTGFSDGGQVDITQTRPGLLAWRGVTIEART